VCDDGSHLWLFVSADHADRQESESGEAKKPES